MFLIRHVDKRRTIFVATQPLLDAFLRRFALVSFFGLGDVDRLLRRVAHFVVKQTRASRRRLRWVINRVAGEAHSQCR